MTQFEREVSLKFIETEMSKETRRSLVSMCCESVKAFQTICIGHSSDSPKLETLFSLIAVESAMKHHAILGSKELTNDTTMEVMAHKFAEALTSTLLQGYDEDLTLEQNLELWKLKKI